MINGIINIYKEAGFTSHDVVAKMRGILKQKKIGHTGTLDPDATGVLPVCVGNATGLCEFLTEKEKEYETVLLLGIDTDTQDIGGRVLSTGDVECGEKEVRQAINSFLGRYLQIPPMYSALKVNGKKLYELARQGKTVERPARPVMIYGIEIQKIQLPRVFMRVRCSKGTYIRTLCYDIGQKLGCGAVMESLKRTQSGPFTLDTAVTLSQLEAIRDRGELENCVIPTETVFGNLKIVEVKEEYTGLIDNGNPFFVYQTVKTEERPENGERVRVHNSQGKFYGIYRLVAEENRYKPVKMFFS